LYIICEADNATGSENYTQHSTYTPVGGSFNRAAIVRHRFALRSISW
jgi:hypothetical protein